MSEQLTFSALFDQDKTPEQMEAPQNIQGESKKQDEAPQPERAKVKYYNIDEELARRSHEMMSFRDYKKNSATDEYRASVDAAAELAAKKKKSVSSFYHDKIDHLLDVYARKLAEWTNAYNRNGASCPSVMICGPANFPTRKKEKQIAREESLWKEYNNIKGILDKIRQIGTGPVDLTDPNAREMLQDQLDRLQERLDRGKQLNAYYRKHKTFTGFPGMSDEDSKKLSAEFEDTRARCPWVSKPFPDYELTSLRGKIKRVQARIEDLNRLEAIQKAPEDTTRFDGGEIIRNAELNRLQIVFDDIPDEETRNALKAESFRWSPKNQAWQRQLTTNAERAARRALKLA